MKTSRGVLTVLIAVNLVALLTTGCCCFRCKKPCPPRTAKCAELIVDGNFEAGGCGAGSICGKNPGERFGGNFNMGPWLVGGYQVALIGNALNGVPYEPNAIQPNFFNTPDGNNSAAISLWFNVSSLSQELTTPLQAGHTYKLSFLQSSQPPFPPNANAEWAALTGNVQVDLVPKVGIQSIPSMLFPIGKNIAFKKQARFITIKPSDISSNPTGIYTIKFSSLGNQTVTIIDAVSFCDPKK